MTDTFKCHSPVVRAREMKVREQKYFEKYIN